MAMTCRLIDDCDMSTDWWLWHVD